MSLDGYPAWPDWALDPPPLNDSYEVQFPDLIVRTDFEQGESIQRQLFRNGPTAFVVTWPMTNAQWVLFKGWYDRFASGGQWFTCPVFDGGAGDDADDGYTTRTIRFVKNTLKTTRDGGEWMVSVTYETMDKIAPSESDTAALALTWNADDGTEAGDVADLFHAALVQLQGDLPWIVTP